MGLVHWRKTMLFRLFVLGMKPQLFGFRLQNFNFQITFPIILFFSRYLLPEKGRKNHPSHFIYRRLPCKKQKREPLVR